MWPTLALLMFCAAAAGAADDVAQTGPQGAAIWSNGALTSLRTADGAVLAAEGQGSAGLRLVGQNEAVTPGTLPGAAIEQSVRVDPAGGDWLVQQQATSPKPGLWAVQWQIDGIPTSFDVLVPGRSGQRLSATSPPGVQTYDWPMTWEAGLVVVQGPGFGLAVWADDPDGRYKQLQVERRKTGWRLTFATVNNAPWEALTTCRGCTWRLSTWKGDWRVPCRRYREWQERNLHPTPLAAQHPAWVKDIRGCVIMGLDLPQLDALAKRVDPKQTLLYIPEWRQQGYDRGYPSYDRPVAALDPFLKRAHELGFRCMLHANYFGCDPLNPEYEQFKAFQVRSPWGQHELEWWNWEKADPPIKFAYINPAHSPFRKLLVQRLSQLCREHAVDALHLDQTLCIENDQNGLIEGLTMAQGNERLHAELRAALPEVALSGEGLDEVTYRHEAFAQRHVWGLNHAEGTWNRAWLECAHPISSYLLRPYTTIYGYLGCSSPSDDQLYAAWQEAYRWWGVIPTLKPDASSLAATEAFPAQCRAEFGVWQGRRVELDLDGDWPADTAFPLRAADGTRVRYTTDRRLTVGDTTVTRTVTGAREVAAPGSIPGWLAYNAKAVISLDPARWYAWSEAPRDLAAFHLEGLPAGMALAEASLRGDHAVLRVRRDGSGEWRLADLLDQAVTGTRTTDGKVITVDGPLQLENGGQFVAQDSGVLHAHPPWKPADGTNGKGSSYARFKLDLPAGNTYTFTTDVFLGEGATGPDRSDGVTFGVSATAGGQRLHAELHHRDTQAVPLALDLTPLAGRTLEVELTVDPGPAGDPSFDWARWRQPRVVVGGTTRGTIGFVSPEPWSTLLSAMGPLTAQADGHHYKVEVDLPGGLVLLSKVPAAAVALPCDLAAQPVGVTFQSESGAALAAPQYAGASPQEGTVDGVKRPGLATHPPNHGRTAADWLLRLPDAASRFHAFVGLEDGSKSSGCVVSVEVNGLEVARRHLMPGPWQELTADLSRWRGQPILLTLVTDSDGEFNFDWARWGEPRISAQ